MALPVDVDATPNYTPAQHAAHHNALAAFYNGRPLDIPPSSPHAKDDEFDGVALDGKWTDPLTSAAGQTNTIQVANGWLILEPATAGTGSTGKHVFGIRQASPTGSFTVTGKLATPGNGADVRAGIYVGIGGGRAHVCGPFQSDALVGAIAVATISNTADWSGWDSVNYTINPPHYWDTWAKIAWDASGGTLTFSFSVNGVTWKQFGQRTGMSQPDQMGIAIYSNGASVAANEQIACDWFRVTEP